VTRVYWSSVDARRRAVYTCRILPADKLTAGPSHDDTAADKNHAETMADNMPECAAAVSGMDALTQSGIQVNCHITAVSIASSDDGRGRDHHIHGDHKSAKDGHGTLHFREASSDAGNGNNAAASIQQAASDQGNIARHSSAKTVVTHRDTSLSDVGDVPTYSTGNNQFYRDSTDNSSSTDSAAELAKSSAQYFFEPDLPAFDCIQHRSSFADVSAFEVMDTDVGIGDDADADVSLRSDFEPRHCTPLKLISQLDGAIPDSDSEASDGDATDVLASCGDVLSRSFMAPMCRPTADHGMSNPPFKCVKCKRIYRTKESCALHSTVCTFELSSSSSERSGDDDDDDDDDEEGLDPTDEETDTCCSDDAADDSVISNYLNSSRTIETAAANCSSLGCQTENVYVPLEDCDLNANLKTLLHHSNAVVEDHLGLELAEDIDTVFDGIENKTDKEICDDSFIKSCSGVQGYFQSTVNETVLASKAFSVVETEGTHLVMPCIGARDISVQIDANVQISDQNIDRVASGGCPAESYSLRQIGCGEHIACETAGSHALCTPDVCSLEAVPRSDTGAAHLQYGAMGYDHMTSMNATLQSVAPYRTDSAVSTDRQMASVSDAAISAVSNASFLLPTPSSRTSSEVSSNSNITAADSMRVESSQHANFSSVSGVCYSALGGLLTSNASLGFPPKLGPVAAVVSSSVTVPSPQFAAVKPQDMLSSSATMVWPSATISPSIVSNSLSGGGASSGGMRTGLLAVPCVPVGLVSTGGIVIPAALPQSAARPWAQPLNVAQPLIAFRGHNRVQSPHLGRTTLPVIRPALFAPVMWVASQLPLVNLQQQLMTVHPASLSAEHLHPVSIHCSVPSTSVAVIPSACQQFELSPCNSSTVSDNNPAPLGTKTFNSSTNVQTASRMRSSYQQVSGVRLPAAGNALLPHGEVLRAVSISPQFPVVQTTSQMTPGYSQFSHFRLRPADSSSLPLGSKPSVCSAAFTSLHHLVHTTAALSEQASWLSTSAAIPWCSTLSSSPVCTSVKQVIIIVILMWCCIRFD